MSLEKHLLYKEDFAMTLPKNLLFDGTEITDDILALEDEETNQTMEFVIFGEFDYKDRHYFYGMEAEDYDKCFGKQNQKELEIQFLEEVIHEDGNVSYSNCTYFSEEEEQIIFDMIKFSLESITVATKYGIN